MVVKVEYAKRYHSFSGHGKEILVALITLSLTENRLYTMREQCLDYVDKDDGEIIYQRQWEMEEY